MMSYGRTCDRKKGIKGRGRAGKKPLRLETHGKTNNK